MHSVSEHMMALIVFLLEMTVDFTLKDSTQQYSGQVCQWSGELFLGWQLLTREAEGSLVS